MPPSASFSDSEIQARIDSVPHWYHQIEIRPGIVTPGINDSAATLRELQLPEDCAGMRVLDIGARDGFFSFELERRGAEVLALDYMEPTQTGFAVASELLGSHVDFVVDNVYAVSPERYGTFDLVLFLGVIYHLRDPLLALDRLWEVTREDGRLILETQLLDQALLLEDGSFRSLRELDKRLERTCLMQFYPGDSLRGDPSNFWAPNSACARELLRAANFEVDAELVAGSRGIFHARRVDDPTTSYHRRLEKGTLRDLAPPPDPSADAGAVSGDPDDEHARLRTALASAGQRQRATDDELAEARRYIAGLEEEIARKERELTRVLAAAGAEAAPAAGPARRDDQQPPSTPLRRVRSALGGRRRER